jgi:hypothetical protein
MKWEKLTGTTADDYEYWCKRIDEDDNVFGVLKQTILANTKVIKDCLSK